MDETYQLEPGDELHRDFNGWQMTGLHGEEPPVLLFHFPTHQQFYVFHVGEPLSVEGMRSRLVHR